MSKIFRNIIALILVITLIGAHLIILGENTKVYALSDEELIKQDSSTNHKNVEFNAYLEGETHSKSFDINSKEAKIHINIKVKDTGYLENGVIEFQNANFKIKDEIQNENIQKIDTVNNKLVLNRINNGSDINIELPIEILKNDNVSLDYFNKETTTKFNAKYIDGSDKENTVEKEVINKISWKDTAEAELIVVANKFVPFISEDNYGVMVQVKVNSKVKGANLPIMNTNIEMTVPTINNVMPTSANVISTKTIATNGKTNGIDFTNNNYSYDAEDGKVVINASNLQDSISWNKNDTDEYLVTYIYEGKEVYEYAKTNGMDSSVTAKAKLTLYNSEELNVNKEVTIPVKFTEKVGTVTDFEMETQYQISKGYVYANYDSSKKVETEYSTNYIVTVNNAKITKSIEFLQKADKFITNDEREGSTIVDGTNYAYNKRIEVNQSEFNKILGEDGIITVKDNNGTELGIINKDTKLENGVYYLDLSSKNNNELDIITSAPITEGQLKINVVKALKGNIGYSKEQMKDFTKIKMELEGKTNITTYNAWKETLLKEPETKVELEINKKDLTTVVANENVEIRVVLDTSSEYNALFENPTLKIVLPSEIKDVNLKSANILFDSGLKIKNKKVEEENGRKVINIELEGKQTEYSVGTEYKGPTIVLNTDLVLEQLTAKGTEKIKLEYNNGNTDSTKTSGKVEQEINYVAPMGVVAATGIKNYKEGAKEITTISDDTNTIEIDTYSNKRTVSISGNIINNYSNNITGISVLGILPAKGNKEIDTNKEIGSTFTADIASEISVDGIDSSMYTIYYSDNINPTKDIKNPSNGWGTEVKSTSKSYLIVFNEEFVLNTGDNIKFSYNMDIPEQLEPNNEAGGTYKVYYTNNSDIGDINESKTSSIIKLSTGKGPELNVQLSPTVNEVREGQIVKMKVEIDNSGEVTAENVKLNISAPEYTSNVEYVSRNGFYPEEEANKVIDVGDVKAGNKVTKSYYIKIDEYIDGLTTNEKTIPISNTVTITGDNFSGEKKSNECILDIKKGDVSVELIGDLNENSVLVKGNTINYRINLQNISEIEKLNDVQVSVKLPQGLVFKDGSIKDSILEDGTVDGIEYNKEENLITAKIDELESDKTIEFNVEVSETIGSFSIIANARVGEGEENHSNVSEYKTEDIKLAISELTSTPKYVKETEELTYNFSITNEGNSVVKGIEVKDKLPEGVTYLKTVYNYGDEEIIDDNESDGEIFISINQLKQGETVKFSIIVNANLLPNEEEKQVKNKITVSAQGFGEVETNEVTNIIEYNSDAHDGNGEGNTDGKFKITGTAWVDSNADGKRDNGEEKVSGIEVILLDKSAKTIIKDMDTGENKIVKTNEDGSYEFNNLPKGEYIAVFLYDSSNYSLTDYKKAGVDSSYNSDVIDINITYNGERRIAAITDVLNITNDNVRDIDIGLCKAEKFDLRLDKYINKITLKTPTIGTRVDEYDNEQLAKVEVLEQNLGKSNAVIEYKIVVTNEGAVPGYVKKIVDYLPKETSFNSELNPNWYLSDNGNIYNASLANEKINPGESKEVTLIVNVNINEETIGTINNNAEIYECYNEQGLKDIDSEVANKNDSEDDISVAEVIVSLVTGKIALYTTLILVTIIIIGFSIYEIKKRVLNKKN